MKNDTIWPMINGSAQVKSERKFKLSLVRMLNLLRGLS